jgi:oligoendopeptidase F
MRLFFTAGDVIRLTFWDHVQNSSNLLKCSVYGKVLKVGQKKVVVESWTCHAKDKATVETNSERFAIIRSTIVEYEILSEA